MQSKVFGTRKNLHFYKFRSRYGYCHRTKILNSYQIETWWLKDEFRKWNNFLQSSAITSAQSGRSILLLGPTKTFCKAPTKVLNVFFPLQQNQHRLSRETGLYFLYAENWVLFRMHKKWCFCWKYAFEIWVEYFVRK